MKDIEFLELRQRSLTRRLGRRSRALNRDVERLIAPWIQEHPKAGLAAGVAAGALLGAAVAPSGRKGRGRGPITHGLDFLKGTAAFALRTKLVDALEQEDNEES